MMRYLTLALIVSQETMRGVIFYTGLRPLIQRNYRLRAAGKRPDEWYWADRLAMGWGYFV